MIRIILLISVFSSCGVDHGYVYKKRDPFRGEDSTGSRPPFSLQPPRPAPAELVGDVTNALTGLPLPNANIELVGTGQVVQSDANGQFGFSRVALGAFQLNASLDQFIPEQERGVAVSGRNEPIHIVMSPVVPDDQLRVVLTWGQSPSDLDTHLFTRLDSGINYHIFYQNKDEENANLDVDDVSSFGPETLTLRTNEPGRYSYKIYDYTNGRGRDDGTLAESGAVIKIYQGSNITHTFTPTNSQDELTWHVFDLVINRAGAMSITEIDTYSNVDLDRENP
jgi:hypothetical protein